MAFAPGLNDDSHSRTSQIIRTRDFNPRNTQNSNNQHQSIDTQSQLHLTPRQSPALPTPGPFNQQLQPNNNQQLRSPPFKRRRLNSSASPFPRSRFQRTVTINRNLTQSTTLAPTAINQLYNNNNVNHRPARRHGPRISNLSTQQLRDQIHAQLNNEERQQQLHAQLNHQRNTAVDDMAEQRRRINALLDKSPMVQVLPNISEYDNMNNSYQEEEKDLNDHKSPDISAIPNGTSNMQSDSMDDIFNNMDDNVDHTDDNMNNTYYNNNNDNNQDDTEGDDDELDTTMQDASTNNNQHQADGPGFQQQLFNQMRYMHQAQQNQNNQMLQLFTGLSGSVTTTALLLQQMQANNANNGNQTTKKTGLDSAVNKAEASILEKQVLTPTFTINGTEDELTKLQNRNKMVEYIKTAKEELQARYNDAIVAKTLTGAMRGIAEQKARLQPNNTLNTTDKVLAFYDAICPITSKAVVQFTLLLRTRAPLDRNKPEALLTVISNHKLLWDQHKEALQYAHDTIRPQQVISETEHTGIVYNMLCEEWQNQIDILNGGEMPTTWAQLEALIKRLYNKLMLKNDMKMKKAHTKAIQRSQDRFAIQSAVTKTGHSMEDITNDVNTNDLYTIANMNTFQPRGRRPWRGGYQNMGTRGRGGRNFSQQTRQQRFGYQNPNNRTRGRGNLRGRGTRGPWGEFAKIGRNGKAEPYRNGDYIPTSLVNAFKKLQFDQAYGNFTCHTCKRGGHSHWPIYIGLNSHGLTCMNGHSRRN